jgi:DNA-binding FadR family transcriptional regulator
VIVEPRPHRGERLADQLYGQILQSIVSGVFGEGDKLPSENELCRAHAVSRPVVREALLRLQADGLVYSRQGVGSFIKRRPPPGLIQFAEPSDVAGVLRCFEARLPLEGATASLAAQRGSARSVRAIGRTLVALEEAMGGDGLAADADFDFHMAVAKATGNDFFVGILSSLHIAIAGSMRVALGITKGGSRERIRRVCDEHEAIHDAIVARDPEAANLAMRYHLYRARQRITDHARDR